MKIEASIVKELFTSIKYFTDAINETINMGEDGFTDGVKELAAEIDKAIDTFVVMNLQELKKIDEDRRHEYLKHYEKYANQPIGNSDEKKMYKAHLYLYVKKIIRDEVKAVDLAAIENDYLAGYLDNNIVQHSRFASQANSDNFFWPTLHVLQDIANELIEQRKKAPQQTLFNN